MDPPRSDFQFHWYGKLAWAAIASQTEPVYIIGFGATLLTGLVIRNHCSNVRHNRVGRIGQNSILPWNAIMRGELSPPSPTPSSPVGGEMVLVNEPKPV
jgi:hypothetical protein